MTIHEINYEVEDESKMEARTLDISDWEKYVDGCMKVYNSGNYAIKEEICRNSCLHIFTFICKEDNTLLKHKAYILLDI